MLIAQCHAKADGEFLEILPRKMDFTVIKKRHDFELMEMAHEVGCHGFRTAVKVPYEKSAYRVS